MNKKKFAVLGFPVEHSLSPVIHNSFAKQINIDISYSKIKVDLKKFKEVVIQLRDEKFIEYHTNNNFLDKIEKKFGRAARKNVTEMTKIKLKIFC